MWLRFLAAVPISSSASNAVPFESQSGSDKCIGVQEEVEICTMKPCKGFICVDCIWGDWSENSACACDGLQERHRSIRVQSNYCGKPCVGNLIETRNCQPDCEHKPTDCKFSPWSDWSSCTATCGGGRSVRSRDIGQSCQFEGEPCLGDLTETRGCEQQACEDAWDCIISEWDEWSDCSKTCDIGQSKRSRDVMRRGRNGGKMCDAELAEVKPCSLGPCGVKTDCVWGAWEDWSSCTRSCGGATKVGAGLSRLLHVKEANYVTPMCYPRWQDVISYRASKLKIANWETGPSGMHVPVHAMVFRIVRVKSNNLSKGQASRAMRHFGL